MTWTLPISCRIALFVALSAPLSQGQHQIEWISAPNATNVTGNGTTPMDGGFRFELGVFSPGFTPTQGNIGQWVANWNPAQRTVYRAAERRYAGLLIVNDNTAPFTAGTPAYVWGFKGDPTQGEWILFRAASWTWPAVSGGPPAFDIWAAKDAAAVLGAITSTGTPYLMRSAGVSNLAPPITTWAQWLTDELSGETLIAANDDPDRDGIPNYLEFILGTSPKQPNPPIPFSIVADGGSRYLQLSVPRRSDRPANLVVEVSADLKNWFSGPSNTLEVANTASSLVVRDLTPMAPPNTKRFIRLRGSSQ